MRLFKPALASIIILVFSSSCEKKKEERRVFDFLFKNQWDSVRSYVDDSNNELENVLRLSARMQGRYDFSLDNGILILKETASIPDTIRYSWDESSHKLKIDTTEVMKLFSKEKGIRRELVLNFIKINNSKRAWQWLNYPVPLEIDSIYGELFYKLYYDFGLKEFGMSIPRIKRAWGNTHIPSGFALSYWYRLSGERDKGILILKTIARRGNSEAMVELGDIYDTYSLEMGYTPPSDARPESQFLWFRKAAELSNAFAMYRLGFIYERGINKNRNIDSAVYWYRKGSKLGESSASSALGVLFLDGSSGKRNMDSGFFWLQKAIKQDPVSGYMEVGKVYEKGKGLEPDNDLALRFYRKADSAGSKVAKLAIRRMMRKQKRRTHQ